MIEKVNNKTILIAGNDITFKYDIAEIIKIKELFFVRLSIPTTKVLEFEDFCNVFCITAEGKLAWQIKNFKPKSRPNFQLAPIVLLNGLDNGLKVTDFMGRQYTVNVNTGDMDIVSISK